MGSPVRPEPVDPRRKRRVADPFADLADIVPGVEPAGDDPFSDLQEGGPSLGLSPRGEGALASSKKGRFGAVLSGLVEAVPFGEEMAAGIATLRNKQPYQENLDYARGFIGQSAQEHPVTTYGTSTVGAMMVPGMGAARGPMTVGRAAKIGGTTGAVYGAGAAEGGVRERLTGAAMGGTLGAVTGAAAGKLLPSAGTFAADVTNVRPAPGMGPRPQLGPHLSPRIGAVGDLARLQGEKGQLAFHGTSRVFDEFDLRMAGTGAGSKAEKALFFSTDPEEASHYAEVAGAGFGIDDPLAQNQGAVMPVFLDYKNPYVSKMKHYNSKEMAREIRKAKAAGHDAIAFPEITYAGERGTVAVFSPQQVRSALSPSHLKNRPGKLDLSGAAPVRDVRDRALEKAAQDLQHAGKTPQQLRERLATIPESKPVSLMELGGENAIGRARAARAIPSRAKEVIPTRLHERQAGAEERIINDLIETSGIGKRMNVYDAADDIIDARSKDADRLYGQISDVEVSSPELVRFLKNKNIQRAYARAQSSAENRATAEGDDQLLLPALDEIIDEKGSLKKGLSLATLDRVKRGLDDLIYAGKRGGAVDADPLTKEAGGLGPDAMASLKKLRGAFVKVLDDAVPEYKNARDVFAGHTAMKDALEEGRKLYRTPPALAERMLRDMSASEREMYRKGAIEAFFDRVEGLGSGSDIARRVGDKTLDKKRMRLLFEDDAAYDQFRTLLGHEAWMAHSRNTVLGNSQTADKLMEIADMLDAPIEPVMQLMTGNPTGAASWLMRAKLGSRNVGRSRLASEVGDIYTAGMTGRQDLLKTLDALDIATRRMAERSARQAKYSKGTGASTGAVVGREQKKKDR